MKHFDICISGHVQHVGFRYWTLKIANDLNIKGFVKNTFNGDVFISAEGNEFDLQIFIGQCNIGPSHARVENVEIEENSVSGFVRFEIR
jgi:acylphosphatase